MTTPPNTLANLPFWTLVGFMVRLLLATLVAAGVLTAFGSVAAVGLWLGAAVLGLAGGQP